MNLNITPSSTIEATMLPNSILKTTLGNGVTINRFVRGGGHIKFEVTEEGSGQVFTDAKLLEYSSVEDINLFKNGIYVEPEFIVLDNDTLTVNLFLELEDTLYVSSTGSASIQRSKPSGVETSIQFNKNDKFAGDADFTYDDETKTLTVENIVGTITEAEHSLVSDVANLVEWANVANSPIDISYFINDSGYLVSTDTILNADHANVADSANSVAWVNVSDSPTKVSFFTNDSGYLISTDTIDHAIVADSANAVSWGNVTSKPIFSTVATSGSYVDLTNKPTNIQSANTVPWTGVTGKPTTLAGYGITNGQQLDNDLTAISNLTGTGLLKRTGTDTWALDTNTYVTTTGTVAIAEVANAVSWGNVTGKPTFSTVATSGSYDDLSNKPNLAIYIPIAEKGVTNGVVPLNSSGKINSEFLNLTGAEYKGVWNAATNSPSLANGTGTNGHFYYVSVGGTQDLGNGSFTYATGSLVIYDDTTDSWNAVSSGSTVTTVNGQSGTITLDTDDIGEGTTNKYYTLARVQNDQLQSDWDATTGKSVILNKPTTISGYGILDAQPLDSDLTAIAGLTGSTGILKKTATDTWALDTNSYAVDADVVKLTGNQTVAGVKTFSNATVSSVSFTAPQVIAATVTNQFILDAADGTGPRLKLGTPGAPTLYYEIGSYNNTNNFDSKTRDLKLFSTARPNAFTLKADTGFVGLNNVSPTQQLDVTGNVKATGFIGDGSQITNISYTGLLDKPTTLSGYGITDAVDKTTNQTVGGIKTFSSAVQETSVNLGTGTAINVSQGAVFTKTINTATTFTITGAASTGLVSSFILQLTNGGGSVITYPTSVKWDSGTKPTLTAVGVDILGFYTIDNGTTWRGMVMSKDSK